MVGAEIVKCILKMKTTPQKRKALPSNNSTNDNNAKVGIVANIS